MRSWRWGCCNSMNTEEKQIKILAQAIYEIRQILSHKLNEKSSEGLAASLAYALHNEAEAILENRPKDFKIDNTLKRLDNLANRYDEEEYFNTLFDKYKD